MLTVTIATTSGSASGGDVVAVVVVLLEVVVGGAVLVVVVVGRSVVVEVVTVVEVAGIVVVDATGADVVDESAVPDVHEETPRSSPKARTAVFRTELSIRPSYTHPPPVDSQCPLSMRGRCPRVCGVHINNCQAQLAAYHVRGCGLAASARHEEL